MNTCSWFFVSCRVISKFAVLNYDEDSFSDSDREPEFYGDELCEKEPLPDSDTSRMAAVVTNVRIPTAALMV